MLSKGELFHPSDRSTNGRWVSAGVGRRNEPEPGVLWEGGDEIPTDFVTLPPSSTSFDLQGCKACWWATYVAKEKKPHLVLPKVFNAIDGGMKAALEGRPASVVAPGLEGTIEAGRSVRSRYVVPKGCKKAIRFNGRTDVLIRTASGVVIPDNKTSEVKDAHRDLYGRQLGCYAYCFERPDKGEPTHVTGLGLFVFEPEGFAITGVTGVFLGRLAWQEIPWDPEEFSGFLSELGALVDLDEAPEGAAGCERCATRRRLAELDELKAKIARNELALAEERLAG